MSTLHLTMEAGRMLDGWNWSSTIGDLKYFNGTGNLAAKTGEIGHPEVGIIPDLFGHAVRKMGEARF